MANKQLSTFRRWILSSPPAEWALNQVRELLIGAIKQGRVPRHVAFVMDGNRRFARERRLEVAEGHNLGFEALARILEVCYKSGVHTVTIYAFSIENFKRSRYEVDALMDMAKIKLTQLSQHGELLDRYGARIRILGQKSLLKEDVIEAMDRACNMTAHNDRTVLNVCFPYTSRDEIATSVRETVKEYCKPIQQQPETESSRRSPFSEERIAKTLKTQSEAEAAEGSETEMRTIEPQIDDEEVEQEQENDTASVASSTSTLHREVLSPSDSASPSSPPTSYNGSPQSQPTKSVSFDIQPKSSKAYANPELITAQTITSHLFTADDPPLDLLIRTSGVERLSDFMLWQCHEDTRIVFLDCLWPEFDLWQFLPVMWEYQWRERKEEQRRRMVEDGRID